MSRLHELTEKIDAFFARVEARHPVDIECRTGCSDCCHVRLTITAAEAESIRTLVASWPAERRAALAAISAPADRCAALDAGGRCSIYDARPVVCRSHGVPVRLGKSLPVVCHRNFTRGGPAAADPDCILDQHTVSAILLAVNDGDDRRIDLAALITQLC
ncbi:MAG TPA: YkgJ family cysteine cluster protein [Kofleriaceae bacterium]|nr:YkgJ family cysteine cluster protein [Kofleriaceae bacterium]